MTQVEYLVGVHNFKGRSDDELDVQRGDYIEVLEDDSMFNDSWYFGRNLMNFQTGLFPKDFTTVVTALPAEIQACMDAYDAEHPAGDTSADQSYDRSLDHSLDRSLDSRPGEVSNQTFEGSSSHADQSFGSQASDSNFERKVPGSSPLSESFGGSKGFSKSTIRNDPKNCVFTHISNGRINSTSTSLNGNGTAPNGNVPPLDQLNINDNGVDLAAVSPQASIISSAKFGPNFGSVHRQSSETSNIDAAISAMQHDPARSPQLNKLSQIQTQSPHPQQKQRFGNIVEGLMQQTLNGFHGSLAPHSVLSWTPQNVETYFAEKGLTEDAPKFANHRITGAILLEMDRETLKEIDIVNFGPRFEIDKEIRQLRQVVGFSPQLESPYSPGTPLSPQSYIRPGSSLLAASSTTSMLSTPLAAQGYFTPQPGMSASTVNALPHTSPNPMVYAQSPLAEQAYSQQHLPQQHPYSYQQAPRVQHQPYQNNRQLLSSSHQGPSQTQNMNSPHIQSSAQLHSPQIHSPAQMPSSQMQNQSLNQKQSQSSVNQQPPVNQQQLPVNQQQPRLELNQPGLPHPQPIPMASRQARGSQGSGDSKEEEITGSLNSNFSMKGYSNPAVAASQTVGRGHHRHTSSATSRYSVAPGANHQRTRTLDEWEASAVPPTETIVGNSSNRPSAPAPSASTYMRNPSSHSNGFLQQHTRNASSDSTKQKRRSSVFSRLSGSPKKNPQAGTFEVLANNNGSKNGNGGSTPYTSSPSMSSSQVFSSPTTNASSVSSSNGNNSNNSAKRTSSDGNTSLVSKFRPALMKQKTSAFQEGIQNVSAEMAAANADKSGWMHKRGGNGIGVWSKRYFTLHATRLSYFANFKDTRERGLIDITGHRVVPVKDHELLVSLSAAGMGAGRHCFKLVPPGPGFRKGVSFTTPKVHYFAVDSEAEMREWHTALMSATIERDESAPVISTCQLPTMSLPRAQELMAERLKTKGEIGSLTR